LFRGGAREAIREGIDSGAPEPFDFQSFMNESRRLGQTWRVNARLAPKARSDLRQIWTCIANDNMAAAWW
jgi:hypothetical protein